MYNHDLMNLPVNSLLTDDGLVAVWCTNSEQNYNSLLNDIFPNWNVTFVAKWYWVKVTTKFEPVCNFSEPPGTFLIKIIFCQYIVHLCVISKICV